jgi:hypothetical protein
MLCQKDHRYLGLFNNLPYDQGGEGRHKCAGCAYERGMEQGERMQEQMNLDLNSLPESQAGTVRHKSPHAAFAQGYLDGVRRHYEA